MSSDPGRSAKRAWWRMRGPFGLALSGVLVVVATRAALRRRGTRKKDDQDTGADPIGAATETSVPSGAELVALEPIPEAALSAAGVGPPVDGESTGSPKATQGLLRAMVVLLVLLVGAAVAIALVLPWTSRSETGGSARRSGDVRHSADPPRAEAVTSLVPVSGTSAVVPDTTIAVNFAAPLEADSPAPSLRPAVPGTWQIVGSSEMLFTPAASFVPSTTYTVTVPGGSSGVRSRSGSVLTQSVVSSFTVAPGSVLRLQQLLAKLGYLPLEFSGPTPAPADMALAQPGVFVWRDKGFPAQYTSQWSPTQVTALTKGAVMAFETQNGLALDGDAGPAVWAALFADAAAGKADGEPVTYVLVTKDLPEHLTVWVNGVLTFADVPCNTGVAGAPTTDGTFEVFSHVQVSNMRGTDITGTSYDVTVPWASYFEGGDALHGYPRTAYGFPQSNGCVEMPTYTAGRVWPSTPIGTVVTVVGPTA